MDYLPIFVNLREQPVLVVGAGSVAARKTGLLLRAGARVHVCAPDLDEAFQPWLQAQQIQWMQRRFAADCLDGMRLVLAATSDPAVNRAVFQEGERRGLLVNAVDQTEACRFIMPALVDRSPLVVAISSSGRAPVLARRVRETIERLLPQRISALVGLAGDWRERVAAQLPQPGQRRRFWEDWWDAQLASPQGHEASQTPAARAAAQTQLQQQLDQAAQLPSGTGSVFLVGAGPGDPELLTLRALRLMQRADVVLHDYLVSDGVMERLRRDARRIYVGKKANRHTLPQQDINRLMVDLARQGLDVLRLKGGDPFIFGRGGEEIETLAAEGIPFQIVPGITSASGASCLAGIPLTHRDHAQAVSFVTGHRRNEQSDLDWTRRTDPQVTLVVYMGLLQLAQIAAQLMANGRDADTPVAIVESVSLPDQRVVLSTLQHAQAAVARENVQSPALLIIGNVVRLYERIGTGARSPALRNGET